MKVILTVTSVLLILQISLSQGNKYEEKFGKCIEKQNVALVQTLQKANSLLKKSIQTTCLNKSLKKYCNEWLKIVDNAVKEGNTRIEKSMKSFQAQQTFFRLSTVYREAFMSHVDVIKQMNETLVKSNVSQAEKNQTETKWMFSASPFISTISELISVSNMECTSEFIEYIFIPETGGSLALKSSKLIFLIVGGTLVRFASNLI